MNNANLNIQNVKSKPFETKMAIARQALVEPQQIKCRKPVEPTPFELAMQQQQADVRDEWFGYDDKVDFMDKCSDVEEWD